jgi:hypothetical protein
MSDDPVAALRREAVQKEIEAKALEAARAGAVAAQPPVTPVAPAPADPAPVPPAAGVPATELPPAVAAAAEDAKPRLMTKEELDGLTQEEAIERMDEVDAAMRAGI